MREFSKLNSDKIALKNLGLFLRAKFVPYADDRKIYHCVTVVNEFN